MTFTEFFKRKRAEDSYLGVSLGPHSVRSETDGSIIRRAIVARSGYQDYAMRELEPSSGSNETVSVYRPPNEVLAPAFLASLEGATLVSDHPAQFISPANYERYNKGFVVNAARGPDDADGNVCIEADLHTKSQDLINEIENGKRQVSCGYLYELANEGGRFTMRNLKANHVAVVERARAGNVAQITDSAPAEPYEIDEPPQDDKGESFEKMIAQFHRQDPARVKIAHDGAKVSTEDDDDNLGKNIAEGNVGAVAGKVGGAAGGVIGGAVGMLAGPEGAAAGAVAGSAMGGGAGEAVGNLGHETSGDDSMPEECSCGAAENGSHMKGCKMYGKDAKKCMCDAEDDEQGAQHHKRCPKYFAGEADPESGTYAEDDAADPDQSGAARAVPPRVRGAGPDLIPVTSGGGEGNTNPVAHDAYVINVQALENLRALKPAIISYARRTGDNSGVEHFNRAVVGLKREIGRYEAAQSPARGSQRVPRSMQDTAEQAKAAQRKIADDFDAAVKAARAAAMADTHGFRTGGGARVAVDSAPTQDFDEQVRRARHVALGK